MTYKCKQSRKASKYKRTKIWTVTKEEMPLVNNYRQSVQTLINKSIQIKRKRETIFYFQIAKIFLKLCNYILVSKIALMHQ